MKRRLVLAAAGAWLAALSARSLAQMTTSLRRIAFLHPGSEPAWRSRVDLFRAALKELGYTEGQNIAIDVRWANDKTELLAPLAREIVETNPAVIVTATSAAVAACKKATTIIPIVFVTAANPVEQGFVASYARPGGNITGVLVHFGTFSKVVEIAREALPRARRIAMLSYAAAPVDKAYSDEFTRTAQRLRGLGPSLP